MLKNVDGPFISTLLSFLLVSTRGQIDSREYDFQYNMDVTRPICTVQETVGYVSLLLSTNDEEENSLSQGTEALKNGYQSAGKWFAINSLQTL